MWYSKKKTNVDYICHYGIKGQKWGIRRFQNEDGSYTTEGKKRYLSDKTRENVSKALMVAAGASWVAGIAGAATLNIPLGQAGFVGAIGSTLAASLISPKSFTTGESSRAVQDGMRFAMQEQNRQFNEWSINESMRNSIEGMNFCNQATMQSASFTMNGF